MCILNERCKGGDNKIENYQTSHYDYQYFNWLIILSIAAFLFKSTRIDASLEYKYQRLLLIFNSNTIYFYSYINMQINWI